MSKHIDSLDGIRGAAVLLVVLFHYFPHAGFSVLSRVAAFGWAGVDAFFVLSGFLITGILFNKRGSPHFFRNFYMRRALRLFPLYYSIFALILLLTPFLHIQWRLGHLPFLLYGANMALAHDISLGILGPFTLRHLWSLGVEEQFYFIWPWIVASRLSRTALINLCASIIVGVFLLRLVMVHFDASPWLIYQSLPTRMDSLLVGALIALIPLPSIRNASIVAFVAFGVCCLVAWRSHSTYQVTPQMMSFGYTALALLFGALLVLSLHPATAARRFFSLPVLRFYGKYSYGLYLWHFLLADRMDDFFHWFAPKVGHNSVALLLYFAIALAGSTLVAVASFHYLETPFLNLKRFFKH